jgi:hypothetical protein
MMIHAEPRAGLPRANARAIVTVAIAIWLALASAAPAFAAGGQTGNVSGTVLGASGAPVAGAIVTLASPSGTYSQKTDAGGRFNFLGVVQDTYSISVQAPGYEKVLQPGITVIGGNTIDLGSVRLQHALKTIGRVSATSGTGAFTPNQTVPSFTLNETQIQNNLGKKANPDAQELLLGVPGFQLSASGLVLQGSTLDQVHYQVDGVDFTDPSLNGNLNGLILNGVRSVQVVPGAGDPSQGNAGAGVVNMIVKRGSYPPFGLLDAEIESFPFRHQLNFEYGAATPNRRFSDFISFLGFREAFQYGPRGQPAETTANEVSDSFTSVNDFVNNFVYKFGRTNNQSVQLLFSRHDDLINSNYGGLTYCHYTCAPDFIQLLSGAGGSTGLPTKQWQSIATFDQGQYSANQNITSNVAFINESQLLKLEYNNAFNPSTLLAARFFHTNLFASYAGNAPTAGPQAVDVPPQDSGGSRTGLILELNRQVTPKHLITIGGNYAFNRPVLGSLSGMIGLFDIGMNAAEFLRPPNPNAPVSPKNPCPSIQQLWVSNGGPFPDGSQGCYLQQFFYRQGGTPRVPPLDLRLTSPQQEFGYFIRDQFQASQKLRLDVGVRLDGINQFFGNLAQYNERTTPFPQDPTVPYIANYYQVEHPRVVEPRFGAAYKITPRDALSLTIGRSMILPGSGLLANPESMQAYAAFRGIPLNRGGQVAGYPAGVKYAPFIPTGNPFTGNIPVGNDSCLFYSTTHRDPASGQTLPGSTCPDFAALLYGVNDAFFPGIGAVAPGTYLNTDVQISHLFKNGAALKIDAYYRSGQNVLASTAPLVFIPSSGTYQPGALSNHSVGVNKTTGVQLYFTLPDRPSGFGGFFSATYLNEFTTTPPGSDNPYGQDFQPVILPQSLAAGGLYRAGFVSPFDARLGIVYKTLGGLRINPVLNFDRGYPYGVGNLTPFLYNNRGIFVPQTNLTDQYGPPGATNYVDPANPGSIFYPVISASRGTPESSAGGAFLSHPRLTGDMTVELTPRHGKSTFGVQVLNMFGNYYGTPSINGSYQPVTTGHAGPLTGQSQNGVAFPGLSALITAPNTFPYSAYNIFPDESPPHFRFYYQLTL